ncbi:uncharacterized protein G2W53_039599 [Senna tora]|uniref:Uncharacterized protein n=1 Tax=Senna tora TaxID=362788 RepID=A0A834W3Q6_9FABA|nr:uncharacterized protein G2W53_039599 [Senna tora]
MLRLPPPFLPPLVLGFILRIAPWMLIGILLARNPLGLLLKVALRLHVWGRFNFALLSILFSSGRLLSFLFFLTYLAIYVIGVRQVVNVSSFSGSSNGAVGVVPPKSISPRTASGSRGRTPSAILVIQTSLSAGGSISKRLRSCRTKVKNSESKVTLK